MFCRNLKIPSGKEAAYFICRVDQGSLLFTKIFQYRIIKKPKLCSNYSVLRSIHFGFILHCRNISNTICFSCPSKWSVTPDNGTFKVHYQIKQDLLFCSCGTGVWFSQLFQIFLWTVLTACSKIKKLLTTLKSLKS